MKKQILVISLLIGGIFCTQAQTNQTSFDQVINLLGSPTNYAIDPYFTYAPKAPTKIGGGIMGVYNVNNYVGLGLGLDYLGQFSLVSGNLQLSLPFHPLPNQFPSLLVSPFVLAGVGTAYSGSGNFNGQASIIEDTGAYMKFGHLGGGAFNFGACYGSWIDAGDYSGKRYHVFIGWVHGF